MYAHAMEPVFSLSNRQLLAILIFLSSAVVYAQNLDRNDTGSIFDDRVVKEIYQDAEDWRIPEPTAEDEWRAGEQRGREGKKPRIHFGADSAYEEMRIRQDNRFRTNELEFGAERPTTILRFSF